MATPADKPERTPHPSIAVWRALEGRWTGTKRLWLSRDEPEVNSPATAGIQVSEDGRQVEIDYEWEHRHKRQTAVLTALTMEDTKDQATPTMRVVSKNA